MGSSPVSAKLLNVLLVPMVGIWILHLYQRKFQDAGVRKRAATQWLTFMVIGIWAAAWAFRRFGIGDEWLLVIASLAAALLLWQRKVLLPFSPRCSQCGKAVSLVSILCRDSNACEACEPPATKGETTR